MKYIAGENGGNSEKKTYLDPALFTTKPTWSDRDVNSGPQGRMRATMRRVWRNDGMKYIVGGNGRNPRKTYPDPVSSTNP